ncbi:hypothetical protein R1sor_002332 [Riccia sorocarpa]|uniref:DUF4283 domain-containing protein n=1 Tax=Riccia sorocarpa TaxID=122646 RepID=A0ABD3H1X1_9MARC
MAQKKIFVEGKNVQRSGRGSVSRTKVVSSAKAETTANTESVPDVRQLPDLLIEQLSRLEVAIPCEECTEANYTADASFVKKLVQLATTGIYTYFYERDVSLNAFKGWVGHHWIRAKGIKVKDIRKVSQFAFVAVFYMQKERNEALETEIASIRSSIAAHFTWTPECENQSFKPNEVPTWIWLKGITSWLKNSVAGIFQSIGPVLRLPVTTKELTSHEVSALVLWDPSVPHLQMVTVDLKWEGKRVLRLGFHASFDVLGAEKNTDQHQGDAADTLAQDWDIKPILFRNRWKKTTALSWTKGLSAKSRAEASQHGDFRRQEGANSPLRPVHSHLKEVAAASSSATGEIQHVQEVHQHCVQPDGSRNEEPQPMAIVLVQEDTVMSRSRRLVQIERVAVRRSSINFPGINEVDQFLPVVRPAEHQLEKEQTPSKSTKTQG